jgi:taurine dioxygenase
MRLAPRQLVHVALGPVTECSEKGEMGGEGEMARTELKVVRIARAVGAEVSGIELGAGVSDDDARELRELVRRHGVLVFRGQPLDDVQQIAVGAAFGELHRHPYADTAEHPEIVVATSGDGQYPATVFHTDLTFEGRPPEMAILLRVRGPALGGDTMWASMTAAYDALAPAMQRFLEGLSATHDSTVMFARRGAATGRKVVQATHPVVIVDEVTSQKALYVNRHHTLRVEGLSPWESDHLLVMLYEHIARPEFQVRVRWTSDTVVMWDERLTQHCVVHDYDDERVMHRVTVIGAPPRGC